MPHNERTPLLGSESKNQFKVPGRNVNFYAIEATEVARQLNTNPQNGLSQHEAEERAKKHGPNALPEEKQMSLWRILLKQFYEFMILILIAAAGVSFAIGDYIEAGVILLVVLTNVIIGFVQESKAEKAMQALRSLTVPKATVIRDGDKKVIDAKELVVGDIVQLEEGNRVPADIRLVDCVNLQTTESILTGESEPIDKTSDVIEDNKKAKKGIPLGERKNIAFMSTLVTRGHSLGIVVKIGKQTEIGKISKELTEGKGKKKNKGAASETTQLQQRLNKLGKVLVVLSVVLCVIVTAIGLLRLYLAHGKITRQNWIDLFKVGVSLAVSVIPEGLVAVVTVTMALGTQRMAKKNAVVRKLPAVETLGSVTSLCCDKTGTLTEGKMKLEEIWFLSGEKIKISGTGINPEGEFFHDDKKLDQIPENVKKALIIGALCNNSTLQKSNENSDWESLGDPTEVALLVAGKKLNLDKESLHCEFVHEGAFDSERKRMSVTYKFPADSEFAKGQTVIMVKGALEAVLNTCVQVETGNEVKPINEETNKNVKELSEKMAGKGLRVLALAYRILDQGEANEKAEAEERDLIFLGLVGIRDPPREAVVEAIKDLRSAGIRMYMITGDHPRTALAIAKHLHILDNNSTGKDEEENIGVDSNLVIDGPAIDNLDRGALSKLNPFPRVFARVNPSHKDKVVDALHIRGEVTAMIGDGVNDATALQHADVGVSMGKSGTDLAQQAAAIILMDDNVATLVSAIEEGRRTYDNIKKFILYLLSCNSSEIYVMLIAVAVGMPTPFTAVMILWANLIIDVPPALALGVDPAEEDVIARKPRDPKQGIFTWKTILLVLFQGFLMAGLTLGLYASALYIEGYSKPTEVGDAEAEKSNHARALVFMNLAVLHLVHAFVSRSPRHTMFRRTLWGNKWLIGGCVFAFCCLVGASYIPVLKDVLDQWPLDWYDWAKIGGCVIIHIVLNEFVKLFIRIAENRNKRKTRFLEEI